MKLPIIFNYSRKLELLLNLKAVEEVKYEFDTFQAVQLAEFGS